MIKKVLFCLNCFVIFILSSCSNLFVNSESAGTEIAFSIGEVIARDITNAFPDNAITDDSIFNINCKLQGVDLPGQSQNVRKADLSKTVFSFSNIPFSQEFKVVLEVLYNNIVIYQGESKSVNLSVDNSNIDVDIQINRKNSKINYETIDGIFRQPETVIKEYFIGDSISPSNLPKVEKEGYLFEGWFFDKDCTEPFKEIGQNNFIGDVTLYAKWTEMLVKIENYSKLVNIGDVIKISTNIPNAKIYYTTDGTDPTENSNLYEDGTLKASEDFLSKSDIFTLKAIAIFTDEKSVKSGKSLILQKEYVCRVSVDKAVLMIKDIPENSEKIIYTSINTSGDITKLVETINTSKGTVSLNLVSSGDGIIQENSFKDCTKLVNIDLYSGFKTIGSCAFAGCTNLKTITLCEGITSIGKSVFSNTGLTEFILPSTVSEINDFAFEFMTSLKKADLSKIIELSPAYNGYCMFRCNTNLEDVKLPDVMTDLPGGIFNGCSKLIENGKYSEIVKAKGYELTNNCVIKNNKMIMCFVSSPSDTVIIPDNVHIVSSFCFANLQFDKLVIPSSVYTLEKMFYTKYGNIAKFEFNDTTNKWIGRASAEWASQNLVPTTNFEKNKNFMTNISNAQGFVNNDYGWDKVSNISNLRAEPGDHCIILRWDGPQTSVFQVKTIKIFYGSSNSVTADSGSNFKKITNLNNGEKYTFRVVTNHGDGVYSGFDSVAKEISQYPMIPLNDKPVKLTSYNSPNAPDPSISVPYGSKWEYVEFGYWPQTRVSSVSGLSAETVNTNWVDGISGWDCYCGSNGIYYVKEGADYYKLEPIKWRVLSKTYKYDGTNDGQLLLAENILTNQKYHADNSRYNTSHIRSYLNNDFYKRAFSEGAKENILTTAVDNSYGSARMPEEHDGYYDNSCDTTNDKVFLLSQDEIVNNEYGFKNGDIQDNAKNRSATDYGKLNNVEVQNQWWLRSPGVYTCESSRTVHNGYSWVREGGYIEGHKFDCNVFKNAGVVPAICLTNSL